MYSADYAKSLEEQNEELRERLREFEEGDASYHEIVENLNEKIRDRESDLDDYTSRVDGLESDLTDSDQKIDDLEDAIKEAVSDILTLPEVPLQGLENAIDAIVSELRAVLS